MYLKQAFKGKNKFVFYLITTIIILLSIQIIGVIPLLSASLIKGIDLSNVLNNNLSGISLNTVLILQLFPFFVGCIFLWLCIKYIHSKKFKDIITARSSFDYKRAFKGGAIWGGLLLIIFAYEIFCKDSTIVLNYQPKQFWGLAIICLLFLPFQTSFEELLFRGYYMQGTAVTTKNRWMPLLVTSLFFGLLHSLNPEISAFGFWVAMPNYIIMGLILGTSAIMDDGLEIPLGMHFANNLLGAVLMTSESSALQTPALFIDVAPKMSHTDTMVTFLCGLLFIIICSRIFKWGSFKKIFSPIVFK